MSSLTTSGASEVKAAQEPVKFKRPSQLKEIWRRFKKNKLAVFSLIFIVLLILVVIFADQIVPYKTAIRLSIRNKLKPPCAKYWFGTDGYGRDLFARCVHGSRVSLLIGFASSIFSLGIGTVLGLIAGYYNEKIDNCIMRTLDVLSAIPTILLALSIITALGTSTTNLIIAIAIAMVPTFARIIRSSVLAIVDQEYIEAARAGGISNWNILFTEVLPNAMGPLIVQTTLNVSQAILNAASLSFLGLGVIPPQPEWGAIISDAREFMRLAPYIMVFPGLLIIMSSLAMNLIGDGIRDAMDPKLKS